MNRSVRLGLAAAVLVLTACGDGGDDPEATPTTEPAPTEVATAVATEEPAEPTEAPESSGRTYRIRRGDTLSAIAQRFDTTVRALVRLNDIEDPHAIRAGQRIQIPD